jgi:hypothetical protein
MTGDRPLTFLERMRERFLAFCGGYAFLLARRRLFDSRRRSVRHQSCTDAGQSRVDHAVGLLAASVSMSRPPFPAATNTVGGWCRVSKIAAVPLRFQPPGMEPNLRIDGGLLLEHTEAQKDGGGSRYHYGDPILPSRFCPAWYVVGSIASAAAGKALMSRS